MKSPINATSVSPKTRVPGRMGQTAAYFMTFVLLGLVTASLGPTLPGLAENLNAALRDMSYLFTVRSLGYMAGSFLGGRLYDRFPGHPLMAGMIICMAGLVALVPILPLLWLLALALLVIGLCEGFLDVGGNTLMVWVHRDKVGPFMNTMHFFYGFGAFLSPVIVAQAVLLNGDIHWAYWMIALICLPPVLWLLRQPSPAAAVVNREDATVRPSDPILVGLIATFFFLYTGSEVSLGGWLSTYATTLQLADEVVSAYLTSFFWGALTLGRLASIPLAARFSPRRLLFTDLCLVLAALVTVLLFPGSFIALAIGTVGAGFGMASIFPTMLSLAGSRLNMSGKTTSWFLVGASLGAMVLPWIIGQLFDPFGARSVIFTVTFGFGLAFVLFTIITTRTARRTP